ncbi:hypothetical protein TNCV_332661 [Trichonephila clavipes]|nr:hypothetical protein TNCV_332661 [Trichonephila clavipes]
MWAAEWNEVVSLLMSHASVCNTTMVGFESGDTGERGCCAAALCPATLVLHRVLWYGAVLDITLAILTEKKDLLKNEYVDTLNLK